jgi:hypothetical protein
MRLTNKSIATRKVRANVNAYKYPDGWIEIAGKRYLYYTMAEAISRWRSENPLKARA